MSSLMFVLLACGPAPTTPPTGDGEIESVPWSRGLPRLEQNRRGRPVLRTIAHLHSPWSHDACDGNPQPDGQPNEPCLLDLREGLCAAGIDVAFLTDHPTHAAEPPFADLLLSRPGDEAVSPGANGVRCDDARTTLWLPGIEDELMPLGLERHVDGDFTDRDATYRSSDEAALDALRDAGAEVFVAHTEQRTHQDLFALQDAGLAGIEVFNLHAMFAPNIRPEFLGLDPLDWLLDIEPFTSPDGTAEPDLLVLAVLMDQPPSLAAWDAMLERGPVAGIAGTDAHQNVLPIVLRDGERGDSYRRMLRWFSNHVIADSFTPAAAREAIGAGRSYVAFEVLGTPSGFDVYAEGQSITEMGGEAQVGDRLQVTCPTLHATSPRGSEDPEIVVTVLRDGQAWEEGCGEFPLDTAGVYRVRVDMVPYHLRPFLGDTPEPWLSSTPWILGNAIRVASAQSP